MSAGSEVKIDGTTPYTIASGDTLTLTTGNTATLSDSSPPSQAEVVLVDSSEGLIRGYFAGDVAVELVADIQATFGSAVVTGLPAALTGDDLLRRLLRTTFWEVEINTDDGDPYDDIDRTDENYHDGDYDVLQLLHKACLLIGRVGADSEERAAWSQCLTSLELLNPSSLALADITSILPAYARLKHTIDLFALRGRLPGESPTFAALITSSVADSSEVRADNFKERTGWDWDTLYTLFGSMGTATVDGLTTLLDRMDVIRRAGASAETVASWAASGTLAAISDPVSRSVVAAARSRYSTPAAWAAVARPLRDPVRKAQRDALVSYLIAQEASDEIEEADDLYERYLIDVSMNPEMLTSRIKQAACSVQLFVHRCLFGLESNGSDSSDPEYYDLGDWFNDEDRAEWEWMRTYRVWEAARKVFLYPENWIEPELRDDKSPFFEELEKEIAQGDLNADRAEDTLLSYLDRLHEVSSLQVLASHVQRESDADGTIDLLHVFARTRSLPTTYWYRRRENSATWTAWERIEAGVQGEHLLPVIYNRRLLLFWGEFTEVGSEEQNPSVPSWWEVRLAMSEYRDGRWSAKKLSADPVSLNSTLLIVPSLNLGAMNRYGLLSSISEDNLLTIRLYGASSASVIALHDLANFEVDPCTMEITGSRTAPTSTDRHALEINYWRSPGFRTVDYDENLDRTDHLAVNLGETDADGEPLG
ncbi:MAG TPA: neuraminidase-like domain-containing protein, partial [Myxococcota bacterium]|nr:neuraminidase-like domain-containing protein [Myxococcota bacterium]